jgi:hypothetical protein
MPCHDDGIGGRHLRIRLPLLLHPLLLLLQLLKYVQVQVLCDDGEQPVAGLCQ